MITHLIQSTKHMKAKVERAQARTRHSKINGLSGHAWLLHPVSRHLPWLTHGLGKSAGELCKVKLLKSNLFHWLAILTMIWKDHLFHATFSTVMTHCTFSRVRNPAFSYYRYASFFNPRTHERRLRKHRRVGQRYRPNYCVSTLLVAMAWNISDRCSQGMFIFFTRMNYNLDGRGRFSHIRCFSITGKKIRWVVGDWSCASPLLSLIRAIKSSSTALVTSERMFPF